MLKKNWNSLKKDLENLIVEACRFLRRYFLFLFALSVFFGLVLFFLLPHDGVILNWIHSFPKNSIRTSLARFLSFWGDYPTGTFFIVILLYFAGFTLKKEHLRRAALAALLAASCAGIFANAISCSVGRARPSADLTPGFYGPSFSYSRHSFPSGHAATAMGTAVALSFAEPPIGIPTLFIAAGVSWSRLELNRHFLSDVLAGSYLGFIFGMAFGLAAKKKY